MSFNPNFKYEPLKTPNSIRVLFLAPGEKEEDIYCWTSPSNLDADHAEFPHNPEPTDLISFAIGKTETGEEKTFIIHTDSYLDKQADKFIHHPFQRFIAVSYVWGDATELQQIVLNGEPFFVTRNLDQTLRSIRPPPRGEGVRLWVDAICINQADLDEKSTQIGLMNRVYRQAEHVRAQLLMTPEHGKAIGQLVAEIFRAARPFVSDGNTASQSEGINNTGNEADCLDLNIQEPVASQSEATDPEQPDERSLEDYGLPPEESPLWVSWRQVLASPYFTRVWILQEFVVAKQIKLAVGNFVGNMDNFMAATYMVKLWSGALNAGYLGRGGDAALNRQAIAGLRSATDMSTKRAKYRKGGGDGRGSGGTSLISYLDQVHLRSATDPRDMLFALLGVASDRDDYLPLVTYKKPTASIFTDFAVKFIETGNATQLLQQAANTAWDSDMPSWVPNWKPAADLPQARIADKDFAAGGLGPLFVKITENGQYLHIHGHIIDDIVATSVSFTSQDQNARQRALAEEGVSEQNLFTFEPHYDNGHGGTVEQAVDFTALGLAFAANNIPHSSTEKLVLALLQATHDRGPEFLAKIRGFMALIPLLAIQGPDSSVRRINVDISESLTQRAGSKSPVFEFIKEISSCMGRRLCATSNGLLGLVSQRVEVGDKVVLVLGCPTPLVLRPEEGRRTSSNHQCYRVTSDAYFDGIMYGEGLEQNEGTVERDIFLV